MNIAELFVKIGLTNENAVVKGLKNISHGFDEVKSVSTATKVAIAGVFIGLERLTKNASQLGMDLYKFANATGLSTERLQQLQHQARQFDAEGDVQGTIEGLSKIMTNMRTGQGAPAGFAALLGPDYSTEGKDAIDIFERITKRVKELSPQLGLMYASNAGISSNMFQAMRSMDTAKNKLGAGQLLSGNQIQTLKEINIEWKNFWFALERIGTTMVANFGGPIRIFLTTTTVVLRELAKWFNQIARSPEFIKFFKELNSQIRDFFKNIKPEDVVKFINKSIDAIKNAFQILRDGIDSIIDAKDAIKAAFNWVEKNGDGLKAGLVAAGIAVAAAWAPVTAAIAGMVYILSEIQKFREGKEGIVEDIVNPEGAGGDGKEHPVRNALRTVADTGITAMNSFNEMIGWKYSAPTITETMANARSQAMLNNPRPLMTDSRSTNSTSNTNNTTTSIFNINGIDMTRSTNDPTGKQIRDAVILSVGRVQ